MLPAKHTAGLASCKYLIVLHCTLTKVCTIACLHCRSEIRDLIALKALHCLCVRKAEGISQLFVTGNRSQTLEFWSIGFSLFQVSGLWGLFSPTRLKTFEVDMNNCCKEKKFWACPLKRTKFTVLTMSRQYAQYAEEPYQRAALFHCWGSFQVCRFARIAISHSLAQLHRGSA